MKHEIRRRKLAGQPVNWAPMVPKVIQRVYAARGLADGHLVDNRLVHLLSPVLLGDLPRAVNLLVDAIHTNKTICVAGDYDCDGATGTTVAVRGLRMLGAKQVAFIIPDRFKHGYGLSPGLVDAMDPQPEVIVTVDSGVASVEGVAHAKAKGITVIVTDHHLPGDVLPNADAIVNPNLKGDAFPSKSLAGVGVMFYTLMALRARLRELGTWADTPDQIPDLAELLDFVAIGTIADLVPLDRNNRILVDAGLRRIRQGRGHAGIEALVTAAGKQREKLVAQDIAFSVAPRLNAAGRLENMSLGVEALLCDDKATAEGYVQQLDAINVERRTLQASMIAEAESIVDAQASSDRVGVVVHDASWHAGVVGLVASKLKESLHRPVVAFAAGAEGSGNLHGSGRSIPGFHLRDALALIDARHPGLILKFGGHAMAAGLTIKEADVEAFSQAFDAAATAGLNEEDLQRVLLTDGELAPEEFTLDMARWLRQAGPFGQGFPEPLFDNLLECVHWRVMGNNHLKLQLRVPHTGTLLSAVMFFGYMGEPVPRHIRAVYSLDINEWQEKESLQLLVRYFEPA